MKRLITVFSLLAMAAILVACQGKLLLPLKAEEVEAFVTAHQEEIRVVNEYLIGLGSRDAFIDGKHASIQIDLKHDVIESDTVNEAIRLLWQSGCKWITKSIDGNAITYTIWRRTYDEADCGFAYALDPQIPPELPFQTKLIPLSDDGLYYYLAEYNEWRIRQEAGT